MPTRDKIDDLKWAEDLGRSVSGVNKQIERLTEERDQLRDAAQLVTSFIRINAKMSGPERVGVMHGAGLRQAIFDLDDLLANIEKGTR